MLGAWGSYMSWPLINVSRGARYDSASLKDNMRSVLCLCEGS